MSQLLKDIKVKGKEKIYDIKNIKRQKQKIKIVRADKIGKENINSMKNKILMLYDEIRVITIEKGVIKAPHLIEKNKYEYHYNLTMNHLISFIIVIDSLFCISSLYGFISIDYEELKKSSEAERIIYNNILEKTYKVIYFNISKVRLNLKIFDSFENLIYINFKILIKLILFYLKISLLKF